MNNISTTTKKFIAVLNDNEWSIAKNVGAIASYLNKLITNPRYNQLQKDVGKLIRRIPKGEIAIMLAHKARKVSKAR
jgi:1-deoxy-D-xylulose-5-phosphate synthase